MPTALGGTGRYFTLSDTSKNTSSWSICLTHFVEHFLYSLRLYILGNMDWTPTSFPSPESQIHSRPKDETWATISAYQPYIHPCPYYLDSSQIPFGLGILHEGTDTPSNQTTLYPPCYASPPVPTWSDQMGISQSFDEPMVAGNSGSGMDYVLYSNQPMGVYGPQEMMGSSGYGASPVSTPDRQRNIFASSPYSENTSPNFAPINKDVTGFHRGRPFPDAQSATDAPFFTQMPQPSANTFPTPPPDSKTLSPMGQATSQSSEATAKRTPTEVNPGTPSRGGRRRSSPSCLSCRVCGLKFTRASNCRDHARKAHDPNYQKFYCKLCDVACKRKWDLRRHEQVSNEAIFRCLIIG